MNKEIIFDDGIKAEIVFSSTEISKRVKELGKEINREFKKSNFVCIAVLRGAFVFFADLLRAIDSEVTADFIRVKSYEGRGSMGNIDLIMDIQADISGRDVLIVEDIIDTGRTISFLKKHLSAKNPNSIRVASFLQKPEVLNNHGFKDKIDFCAFEIKNDFVVGYGLDYNQKYRNCEHLCRLLETV